MSEGKEPTLQDIQKEMKDMRKEMKDGFAAVNQTLCQVIKTQQAILCRVNTFETNVNQILRSADLIPDDGEPR